MWIAGMCGGVGPFEDGEGATDDMAARRAEPLAVALVGAERRRGGGGVTPEQEEREWQAMCQQAGHNGVVWALALLMVRKGVITVEEMKEAVAGQAGRKMLERSKGQTFEEWLRLESL